MIPSLQFLGRRVNMNTPAKRKTLKWIVAALSLSLVIGCSTANSQSEKPPIQPDSAAQTPPSSTAPQTSDTARELLLNMKQLAEQGKVINSTFPVKATVIEEVKSRWGNLIKPIGSLLPKGPMLPTQNMQWFLVLTKVPGFLRFDPLINS